LNGDQKGADEEAAAVGDTSADAADATVVVLDGSQKRYTNYSNQFLLLAFSTDDALGLFF